MSQVRDDFDMMCRIGYGCGLKDIGEALSQIARHYDAFFPIEEADDRLVNLHIHICDKYDPDTTIRSVMGDAWCAERDAEEAAYWESQK